MEKLCSDPHMASAPPKNIYATSVLLFVLLGCNGRQSQIDERKLIGSWKVDVQAPETMVYTFRADHTFEMNLAGANGGMAGSWTFTNRQLVTVMEKVKGKFGSMNLFESPWHNAATNTVVELTDLKMVWRDPDQLKGVRLIRVSARE